MSLPTIAPIILAGRDADRPRRAVRRPVRAIGRRQHRHRGHDARSPRSSAGTSACSSPPALGDGDGGPVFGASPALLVGPAGRGPERRRDLAGPRVAVDQRPRRPDHQRHDHQHRRVRADGLSQQPHRVELPDGCRRVPPVPATGCAGGHSRGRLDCSTCSSTRARSRCRVIVIVIVLQVMLFRIALGPADACRRRASEGGRDRRRRRDPAPLPERASWRRLAGLGGAYLSLEATNSFQQGMTAGRGFIGLAAMIVGRWSPLGAFGAALLFSSSQAVGQSISIFAPPSGELGRPAGPAARPVLRRAALRRHHRRARRRRRAEHPAGRGWAALRAGGGDLTSERRRGRPGCRAREGARRSSTSRRDAGRSRSSDDEAALELLRSARVIAVVGASSRPVPAVLRGHRVPARARATRSSR